jgi:serralysin
LSDIENVDGTDNADTITGDNEANRLVGNAGADTLTGGFGNDSLESGNGNDFLYGDALTLAGAGQGGHDWIDGGLGPLSTDFFWAGDVARDTDKLFGDAAVMTDTAKGGDDTLYADAGAGNDIFTNYLYGARARFRAAARAATTSSTARMPPAGVCRWPAATPTSPSSTATASTATATS